jgi:hypothetical protein
MRLLHAELIDQTGDGGGQCGWRWLDFRRQGLGVPESGQVNRDDLEVSRERWNDRIPGLPRQPECVQEYEGFAGASAVIGEL